MAENRRPKRYLRPLRFRFPRRWRRPSGWLRGSKRPSKRGPPGAWRIFASASIATAFF